MSCNIEIEAKIAVEDLSAVEDRLSALGATKTGEFVETDTFFDFDDQRLKSGDSAVRLRDRKNMHTLVRTFMLTYKGPRQSGAFKQREEIEFAVDQPENVAAFLEAVGLKQYIAYTKSRNSWTLDNSCIEVDSIEGVGRFIEVEAPDEESVKRVLKKLNLADEPVIHESYLSMVISYLTAERR